MAGKSKVCTGIQSQLILPNWIYSSLSVCKLFKTNEQLCTKCGENSGPLSLFRIFDFFHTIWESPGPILCRCYSFHAVRKWVHLALESILSLPLTTSQWSQNKSIDNKENYKRYFHLWFTISFLPVWWHMNNMSYLAWLRVFRFLLLLVCIQRLMLLGQFSRNW